MESHSPEQLMIVLSNFSLVCRNHHTHVCFWGGLFWSCKVHQTDRGLVGTHRIPMTAMHC